MRDYALPTGAVLALALGIILVVEAALGRIVQTTILRDAETKAMNWAQDFVETVPDLSALAAWGQPTQDQQFLIDATIAGGDIFRFKLFSAGGYLTFVSDEAQFLAEGGESFNERARAVAQTGLNDVAVYDGRQKSTRPDSYVEAYVPVATSSGSTFGVIEVYVDTSSLAAALEHTLHKLGMALVLGSAIVYLIPSLFLVFRNNQVRKRDREMLRLSRSDPLTGVLNRGAFSDETAEVFRHREANGDAIGLFFIDLDKFKEVNDDLGHDFGDNLLKHVASSISGTVREEDIVGRIGGDEFVVIMPAIAHDDLLAIGERIQTRLREPFAFGGATVTPGLSIGAHLSPAGEREQQAMHAADLAVYRAKDDGRGRLVQYTEDLDESLRRRKYVESSLRRGLNEDGFFLEFQPIFGGDAATVAGFEALLRLRTSDGTVIPPAEFVPVAESAGLISDIGLWTLRSAMVSAADWSRETFVAVNLSAVQFKSGALVDDLTNLLEETGFPASRLELEVTETLLLEDEEAVGAQLAGLKSLGVVLALDDFGTGYSSLGYLWKYQFDKLKIDRVFLEGFDFFSEKYRQIIATIVMLGHQLNMTVTVEGIERSEQLEMLTEMGCDQFQGFYLGRPDSALEARRSLARVSRLRAVGGPGDG